MQKLNINLHKILRSRLKGWKGRLLPGFVISGLERFIHQEELNAVLDALYPSEGSEFASHVYDYFELKLKVKGLENIPDKGRFIFASNHPLGGLDGIGLISVLGSLYGDENVRFLVNDMLMHVEPLRNVFLPINKYGSQGREAARAIGRAYESDKQIIVFPAGLVSRLHRGGEIKDLDWQKSFIQKAVEFERDIIPVYFEGLNRPRFYKTAYRRKKLGIKVNIEQAMLPAELCAARGKSFTICFGKPVTWSAIKDMLDSGNTPQQVAAHFKKLTYELKKEV